MPNSVFRHVRDAPRRCCTEYLVTAVPLTLCSALAGLCERRVEWQVRDHVRARSRPMDWIPPSQPAFDLGLQRDGMRQT